MDILETLSCLLPQAKAIVMQNDHSFFVTKLESEQATLRACVFKLGLHS